MESAFPLYEIVNKLHFPICSSFVSCRFHWANNSEPRQIKTISLLPHSHIYIVNITCCGNHFNASRCTKLLTLPQKKTQGCGVKKIYVYMNRKQKICKKRNCQLFGETKPGSQATNGAQSEAEWRGWLGEADLWDPVRQPLFFPCCCCLSVS